MKLTLKIKLLPTPEQADILLDTIKEANLACDAISGIAWDNKVFNQFKIHNLCYHGMKSVFNLSAQMLVRCISKVADAYKLDRKTKRSFRPLGSIAYDSRILSYKDDTASIWCIGGRQRMPFICHNPKYLPYIKGEADLVYRKGKFYLFQTVDIPDTDVEDVEDFIGVDFGISDIAVTSDGVKHTGQALNEYRKHRQRVRSSIQPKGTRSSRRLLKRLSGKERTHATTINHTISKTIVQSAKEQGKGVAIEDLTGIRFSSKGKGKALRTLIGNWSFYQLRSFIEYKAEMNGVQVVVVNPAFTSKTCSCCNHIGIRKGKSFKCENCGSDIDADVNASINIASLGAAINQPEKSSVYCSLHTT